LRGRVSQVLQFPVVASAFLIAPPWILFFTPLYAATLEHEGANLALHVVLVALGLGYFWPRLQVDPVSKEYPYLVSMGIAFAEVVFDGGLGLLLIYGPLVAGHYYQDLHRPWGDTLSGDQKWGGAAFWVVGDAAGLPYLGALMYRMLRKDKEQQAQVDAELDTEAAERTAALRDPAEAGSAPEGPGAAPEMMRPWWETDPAFARRYGRGPT
jgi:cytochrome c oxidase assembly factor CtaG